MPLRSTIRLTRRETSALHAMIGSIDEATFCRLFQDGRDFDAGLRVVALVNRAQQTNEREVPA